MARLKEIRVQDLMTRLAKAGLLKPEEYEQEQSEDRLSRDRERD